MAWPCSRSSVDARCFAASVTAWARQMSAALDEFGTGGVYVNFLGDEGDVRIRDAYGASKHDRLVSLKDKYDPGNMFRLNQNIRPSR